MEARARNPYVSIFLALVAPCVGHVYAGRVVPGLALAGGTVAVGMLGTLVTLATPAWAGLALEVAGAGWLGLWIGGSIGAIRRAPEAPSSRMPREYDRWYVYTLLVILTYSSFATWALAIREKVVEVFRIPSASMEPSIPSGSRVLVDKLMYRRGPVRRGDIVVFVNPNERYKQFIKRVVALPGDTVEMRDDDVFVNGAKLAHGIAGLDADGSEVIEETNAGAIYRIRLTPPADGSPAQAFGATKVPNGHCFLLGDNRRHSIDSREIGAVPLADIVGRVDRTW
jgi:signal peptidase I